MNNWYFGGKAGITFNTKTGSPVAINDGQLSSLEGCSAISDTSGKLLFYSNGVNVWNRKHELMQNGYGLTGNSYSTQSALIAPKPGDKNLYYIFTADCREVGNYGLQYSIVDMRLNNGYGDVIVKNVHVLDGITEKLAGVINGNNKDIWILAHKWGNDEFYAYHFSDTGLSSTPVISRIGSWHTGHEWNYMGYMKASVQGDRIALGIFNDRTYEIFDFDNTTGKLSNPIRLYSDDFYGAYGLEFSPDGKRLYLSVDNWQGDSKVYWINLEEKDASSMLKNAVVINTDPYRYGALQLGPDGKIYHIHYNKDFLGVINNPNGRAEDCGYVREGISLNGGAGYWGLPNFINGFYNEPKIPEPEDDSCNKVFDYINFKTAKDIEFAGSGQRVDTVIRLTSTKINQAGACWYAAPVPVTDGFVSKFSFRFMYGTNNSCDDKSLPGADGIAFVIQNSSANPIGFIGGGIGYDNIPNSLAIEFDTFSNDSSQIINMHDPNGNHVAVQCAGEQANTANHGTSANLGINSNIMDLKSDGTVYYAKIAYQDSALYVYLDKDGSFSKPVLTVKPIDLSAKLDLASGKYAYVGITSATGCAYQIHDILGWELCTGTDIINSAEETERSPYDLQITAYPNPFGDKAGLSFSLNEDKFVTIDILDIYGKKVAGIVSENLSKGLHRYEWSPSGLADGIYFARISTGSQSRVIKLAVSR